MSELVRLILDKERDLLNVHREKSLDMYDVSPAATTAAVMSISLEEQPSGITLLWLRPRWVLTIEIAILVRILYP